MIAAHASTLPPGWCRASIRDLSARVVVGHVGPSSHLRAPQGIPFLMGKNIREWGLDLEDLERITPEFHARERKSQLSPGDIVVVRIGRSGMAAVIPSSLGAANCSGLVIIKAPLLADAHYLTHYMNSPRGQGAAALEARGTTRRTLNTKSVAATEVPVPPLDEQRRIVDSLASLISRIDDAETALKRAERNLERYRASVLQAAVEGRLASDGSGRYGTEGRSASWRSVRIGDIAEVVRGVTYEKSQAHKIPTIGCLPLLRATNITEELTFEDLFWVPQEVVSEEQRLRVGDLVVASSSGSLSVVGKAAPLRKAWEGTFGAFCMVVRPRIDLVKPAYLRLFMQSPGYRQRISELAAGVNINNLRRAHLLELPLRLPTARMQVQIASEADRLLSVHAAMMTSVLHCAAQLKALLQAVLKMAFEGRLVDQCPADEPASVLLERIRVQREMPISSPETPPSHVRSRKAVKE